MERAEILLSFAAAAILLCTNNPVTSENDATANICIKGKERGDGQSCDNVSAGLRFYYDQATHHCQPFFYDGCGGNDNRFATAAECREKCANVAGEQSTGSESHGSAPVLPVPKCDGGVRAAVDAEARPIVCGTGEAAKCPDGYTCTGKDCCPSTKASVCELDYDTGHYVRAGSHIPRFFYNKNVQNCLLFTYYGALGNANNFETYNDCMKYCKSATTATNKTSDKKRRIRSHNNEK